MTTVTALPDPPSRADPTNFSARADAFFDALADFSVEANALGNSIESAAASVDASLAADLWVSGTTYAVGDRVYSPVNSRIYRRKTAGAGTTDPSSDTTNWAPMGTEAPQLIVVTDTTCTLSRSQHVEMTNAAQCTATLPANPSAGDWVWIGFSNDRADNVIARNGALIMGVEEDMTLDEINGGIVARYVSATLGWRVYPISSLSQFLPVENAVAPAYIPPAAPPWRTSTGSLVADWASCTDSLNNGAARSTDVDGNGTTRSFVLNVNSSGSSVDLTGFTPFSLADTKNLLIWAKASAGASVERPLRILLSTDPGGAWTTYFEICTSIQGDDQWVPISLVRPHWTSNGGATWDAVVTKIRFRANDSTVTLGYPILAGSHTITVGTMRRNATSRPSVLFSCDDAHLSLQGWGAALATHGWAGAAYHYPRHIGYQTRATVDQLRVLKSLGWLIGNHSYKSPDDLASNGSRNLGPVGIGISAASFDSSNIVSVATNRAPPTTTGVVSAIKFTAGTLPAELALNTTYWMRGQTASSIKLYDSYDAANEQDAAGLVSFSASATTATWQYVDALNDSTAIREDFERAAEAIRSWGFGDDGLHVALSQSAYDMYVVNALRRFGARSVRSALAYSGSGDAPCAVPAGFAARRNGSTGAPYGSWCTWPGAADFDNLTALQLQAYVDSLVELGGTGHIYSHTTVDTDKLATLAAYIKSIDGLVVTTPDLWITGSNL